MVTPGYPDPSVVPSLFLPSSIEAAPSCYLTNDEYRSMPNAVDLSALTYYQQGQDEEGALHEEIIKASEWMDNYCNQALTAQTYTWQERNRVNRRGEIRVHPPTWPVMQVTAFAYGTSPASLIALGDLSSAWLEPEQFIVPLMSAASTYAGNGLTMGFNTVIGGNDVFTRYTYTSGYVCTTLTAGASAAATQIVVASATGITAGTLLTLTDGRTTERVTVSSITGTTVTLSSPLVNTHAAGVGCHALPGAVKKAAMLVTTAFLKTRGSGGMTVRTMSSSETADKAKTERWGANEMAMAENILTSYARRR